MTYGGAVSFARRRYSRDLAGADIVISGIPYDNAVTYRPGCRLGPRAIRAGSVQLAELKHFPFGQLSIQNQILKLVPRLHPSYWVEPSDFKSSYWIPLITFILSPQI